MGGLTLTLIKFDATKYKHFAARRHLQQMDMVCVCNGARRRQRAVLYSFNVRQIFG